MVIKWSLMFLMPCLAQKCVLGFLFVCLWLLKIPGKGWLCKLVSCKWGLVYINRILTFWKVFLLFQRCRLQHPFLVSTVTADLSQVTVMAAEGGIIPTIWQGCTIVTRARTCLLHVCCLIYVYGCWREVWCCSSKVLSGTWLFALFAGSRPNLYLQR